MRQKLAEAVEQDNIRLEEHKSQFSELEARLIRQLDEAAVSDEKRLHESQQQFADLTRKIEEELKRISTTLDGFQTMINEAITGAKTEAEKSFRALSLVLLAEQQVRSGNRETAIATLEEAAQLDPKNQTINYLLGYLYVGRKKFEQAVLHLRQVLESNPNFSPALAAIGLVQSRMSDQEPDSLKRDQLRAESEANLVKALMAEPALLDADNESYWGSLGGLRRRQGRDEGAVEAYKKATEVTPNKSYPINNLALLYKKLNQEDEAIEAFNKVIRLAQGTLEDRPGDIWARLDLAQAYLVIGELEKSKREYRLVFERVDVPGPLESALNGLRFLQKTPVPPVSIDEVIAMVEKRTKDIQRKTTQERRQVDVVSN